MTQKWYVFRTVPRVLILTYILIETSGREDEPQKQERQGS